MSDTPRTDARVRGMIDNDIGPEGLEYFARDLERELNAANEHIKRLEEKVKDMESARTRAAANSLANMLAYEDATKKIAALIKELDEANHRIRRLIEERDTARMQADRNYKLREEFEALLGTDDVAAGVANIKYIKRNADRYEVVRKMNASQFAELLQRCLFQDLRFDDEVDKIGGIQ